MWQMADWGKESQQYFSINFIHFLGQFNISLNGLTQEGERTSVGAGSSWITQ
jgi:hypothetical protein